MENKVKECIIDFSDKQRGPGRPRKRRHNSGSPQDNAKSVSSLPYSQVVVVFSRK